MKITRKLPASTLEVLIGILATAMIVAGLMFYTLLEPTRIDNAQASQLALNLEDAMTLYAENCSVCHGMAGEGIGATPPLSNPTLRESDPQTLAKTIARGLYGTSMPAWSLEDGGPLGDYQIDQLVQLIQSGDWQATQDRVVNLGLAPLVPFTAEPDTAILESLKALPNSEVLVQGVTLYAENCVACHGPDGAGTKLAPALNDPAVRQKANEEIVRTIQLGVPGTLMAGWEKSLSADETQALAALIARWEEVPTGAIPAPDKPIPVTEESLALGSSLYTANCANCHGPEGQGSQRAPSLNVKSFLADTNDQAMQQIITLGVPGTSMPVWGDRMTEADIQAIVGFIRSWEPTAPEVATPTRVRGPWWKSSGAPSLPSGGASAALQGSGSNTAQGQVGGQGQGSGQGQSSGQATGSHGQGTGQAQGANSPWTQPQTAWWQNLDPRSVVLIGLVAVLSLGLIGVSLVRLRRLPPPVT
jgi:mono/diheme cytochrome c family protein